MENVRHYNDQGQNAEQGKTSGYCQERERGTNDAIAIIEVPPLSRMGYKSCEGCLNPEIEIANVSRELQN
jgi:hypothetical protein